MHKRTKTILAGRGAMAAASALIIATQSAYGLGLGGGNSGGISAGVSVGGGGGISADASIGGSSGSSGSSGGSLADVDVGIGSGSSGSSSGSNSSGGSLADVDVNVGSGSTGSGSGSGGSLADVDVNIGSGSTGSGSGSGGSLADVDVNVGSGGSSTETETAPETPESTAKAAEARRDKAERDRLAQLPRKFREVVGAPVFTKDGVYLGQVRWIGGKRGAIRAKVSLVQSAGLGTKLVELGLQNRNLRKGVIRLGLAHDRLAEMIGS